MTNGALRVELLRAAARTPRPWKNGGGLTTEIAVYPPGAALDAFDWRVSTAEVGVEGPFSQFPGIDRTLAVLDGVGMTLVIGSEPPVHLTSASAPFAFAADRPTNARLTDGRITDLNIMTRRGVWRHTVERIDVTSRHAFSPKGTPWLVYCHRGAVSVSDATETHLVSPGDAVLGTGEKIEITTKNSSVLYVIEFHRV